MPVVVRLMLEPLAAMMRRSGNVNATVRNHTNTSAACMKRQRGRRRRKNAPMTWRISSRAAWLQAHTRPERFGEACCTCITNRAAICAHAYLHETPVQPVIRSGSRLILSPDLFTFYSSSKKMLDARPSYTMAARLNSRDCRTGRRRARPLMEYGDLHRVACREQARPPVDLI